MIRYLSVAGAFSLVGLGPAVAQDAKTDYPKADPACVVTEDQLFAFFVAQSGGGMAYANSAVIALSNDPATEVIGRAPFTYRIRDAEICAVVEQAG
ncbi:hypothetical protein KTJ87_01200 [Rhodobacteraceae bacterium ASV31]|nr:hypothetical protein [Anianabacter salinae]